MHKSGIIPHRGKVDWNEFAKKDPSIHDYGSYIPIKNSVKKLQIWKEKGVEILLNALAGLRNIKCSIVGDGSLKDKLIEKTRKLDIQRFVQFRGFLPQRKVFELMEKADALVLPSYSEYSPNVLIEAALIGLPVIASEVGGIKYLLKNGETAILFEKGNEEELRRKISFLRENSAVREKIRVNAKEFVCRSYIVSATERSTKKVLYELISSC